MNPFGLFLERPLFNLDLETTGRSAELDRVIQIGLIAYYPDREPVRWKTFVDPEMAIPAEIQHKVKITDADVAGAPTWRALAPALAARWTGVDFMGYNLDFDLKFSRAEMRRAGVAWDWELLGSHMIDALAIYRHFHPRTLTDAYREYGGEDGQPLPDGHHGLEGAHDALVDVTATEAVLRGQLLRHIELPRTVEGLEAFTARRDPSFVDKTGKIVWRNHVATLSFGKHAGVALNRLDAGYIQWMIGKDFPADTKEILLRALSGDYPAWVPRG